MRNDKILEIKNIIRDIPDFPKKGIIFKDITTLLNNRDLFCDSIDYMCELVSNKAFNTIAAIESRGFIFGAAMAYKLNLRFVPIRKPGKLPAEVLIEEYALEYGTDRVEIHADALDAESVVLIVDDLLATGGTAEASCKLIERSKARVAAVAFLVELKFLHGRELLNKYEVLSLINYD